jgi:hypothetical protein
MTEATLEPGTREWLVAELDKPLDPERIKGREGPSGQNLSYLSQDDVKRRANALFGFGGWEYKPDWVECIGSEPVERTVKNEDGSTFKQSGTRVAYKAQVCVTIKALDGASYTDVGYGEDVSYTSVLQPHELAEKEAVSDAVKRAMVALGDQFGLSLYEKKPAAGGRHAGRGQQARAEQPTRTPPTLTENDLRAIHAERNKFKVSEDDLKRVARFCADMPSLRSMKDVPRSAKAAIIDALGYLGSNPADAEAQLAEFEANAGITSAVNDPAAAEAGPPRNAADAAAQAEAAGIPDGYG